MPQDTYIPESEYITGSIRATFDSVDLCNTLIVANKKTEQIIKTVERNKAHLEIMLGKDWFSGALLVEQRSIIDVTIASSSLFIL